jgi:hypothetical protein
MLSGLDASDRLRVLNIPLISRTFSLLSSLCMLILSAVKSRIESMTFGASLFPGSHQEDRSTIQRGSSLARIEAANMYLDRM